jgi:nucleotide-binding universal stress UspA family protein
MKVILAVDGSPCSDAAVAEINKRKWPAGTSIKVLSAVHTVIPDVPDAPLFILYPARMELIQKEERRLIEFQKQVVSQLQDADLGENINIETQITEGSPKDVIIDEAQSWQADLIVMGCHGYGNVKRFLLGSVSQAVAVHAPCSVQIVRTPH